MLKLNVSSQNIQPDNVVIGCGGILWVLGCSAVHWPKEGLLSKFIDGFKSYIFKMLQDAVHMYI